MTLRRRLLLYLVVLHLVFAALALLFLGDHRTLLLGVEVLFVVSFAVALRILRRIFEPLDLLRSGVAQLRDNDFTTRFRASGQPELDGLVGVYNQMADRLREERTRQQEQNAFLERVLAASPAGIIVLDFDARIASANPAARRMLGLAAASAPSPGTNGDAEAWIGRTLAEQGGDFASALAAIPEGEARVVGLHGSRRIKCQRAHFMDRGFPRSFLVLEELTEEVRRAEKSAYDKLIRMMSHEVNNTTAAVASLLSSCLAYREQVRDPDRHEFTTALEVAIGRTRSLSGFMNDFADVVRLPEPRRRPSDIVSLLEAVVGVLREEAQARRIEWIRHYDAAVPMVELDPVQIEQVLLNVVKNALEAIGTSGTITLTIAVHAGQVTLGVRDDGPGIAAGSRDQLFTSFHTTKENGQGIGLTLAREILVAHRFEFSLDNATGGGAEFIIRMPASES